MFIIRFAEKYKEPKAYLYKRYNKFHNNKQKLIMVMTGRLGVLRNSFGSLAQKVSNSPLMAIPSIGNIPAFKGNGLSDVAEGLKGLRASNPKELAKNLTGSASKLATNAALGGSGGRLMLEGTAGTVGRSFQRQKRVAQMGGGLKKRAFAVTRGFGDGLRRNRNKLIDGVGLSTVGVPPAFATKTTSDFLTKTVNNNNFLNNTSLPFGGGESLAAMLTKQRNIPTKELIRKASGGLFTSSVFIGNVAEFN